MLIHAANSQIFGELLSRRCRVHQLHRFVVVRSIFYFLQIDLGNVAVDRCRYSVFVVDRAAFGCHIGTFASVGRLCKSIKFVA